MPERSRSGIIVRFMGYLTSGLIYAVIVLILFSIWGGSGGFSLITKIGQAMAKIPAWAYLALGGFWLFNKIVGK